MAAAATVTEALILRADLYAALGGSCGRGCIDIGGEGDSGGGGGGGCLATVAAAATAAAATDAGLVVAVGGVSRGAPLLSKFSIIIAAGRAPCSADVRALSAPAGGSLECGRAGESALGDL